MSLQEDLARWIEEAKRIELVDPPPKTREWVAHLILGFRGQN